MKLLPALLGCVLAVAPPFAQSQTAHTLSHPDIASGEYHGTATVHGQQVPAELVLREDSDRFTVALVNGRESSTASSVTLVDGHLSATFDYYARTLEGTFADGTFTGTFGTATTRYPLALHRTADLDTSAPRGPSPRAPRIDGDWEIAVKSAKGESAWQLVVDPPTSDLVKAVIQRIDGDTGSLYGGFDTVSNTYRVSHFTAAGAALYELKPQPDGTLLVSNLLNPAQTNLVARRPAEARTEKLTAPTDPTQQTTLKDPSKPFVFSYPDVSGRLVSSSDPIFDGKVIIVAIGGSWCPNCHDEAPTLESLYKQFHGRGLEIVDLSFEEADQMKDPARLRAFIARYGITYTVLLAGDPDQLNEKITIANNLNCWPTSFFIGRDGRVREIHAGFAGPANPVAHAALEHNVRALVEQLLAEAVPAHNAALSQH